MKTGLMFLICALWITFTTLADWPIYQGSASLTGFTEARLPSDPARRWRVDLGSPIEANPIIYEGKIIALAERGPIIALALNGAELWRRDFGSDHSFSAPPLAVASSVIVASEKGVVFALAIESGEIRWRHDFGEEIIGTPNWYEADGEHCVVVLGRRSGRIRSISLSDGQTIWNVKGRARCDGSPSVSHGILSFGDCNAEVYFYSLADGKLLGTTPLGGGGQIASGVAVSATAAYTGTHGGGVYKIDIDGRTVVWKYEETDGPVYTTPALAGEVILFASDRGTLYCLAKDDGEILWKREIDPSPAAVAIADNRGIVSASGALMAFDLSNGAQLWRLDVADETTAPALADKLIVVGSSDGNLWAFGERVSTD